MQSIYAPRPPLSDVKIDEITAAIALDAANADLQKRELIKLATLSAGLTEGLRCRGVDELDASLAAEAGIAVFRVAFGQWVAEAEQRGFGEIVTESLARLKTIASIKL
jgi:hypothetical protein